MSLLLLTQHITLAVEKSTTLRFRWWSRCRHYSRRGRRRIGVWLTRLLGETLTLLTRLYNPLCEEVKEPTTTHGNEMLPKMMTHLLRFGGMLGGQTRADCGTRCLLTSQNFHITSTALILLATITIATITLASLTSTDYTTIAPATKLGQTSGRHRTTALHCPSLCLVCLHCLV